MTFQIHDSNRRQLAAVETTVADLTDLGLVSPKDAKAAKAAIERANQAETLSATYVRVLEARAREAGDLLADTDGLSIDLVIDAVRWPDAALADTVLASVWKRNVVEARKLVLARIGEAPTVLTVRMDAIREAYEQVRPKLSAVTSADEAIDLGLTDEWREVSRLQAELKALVTLRDRLRSFDLIPAGRGGNAGAHWSYRKAFNPGALQRAADANDGGRALFAVQMAAEPYVAGSAEEAIAVLEAQAESGVAA